MSRIDHLPALSTLPWLRLLGHTDRMRDALSRPDARLHLSSAIRAQAKQHQLVAGIRTWALMVGELEVMRLPGGALADDGTAIRYDDLSPAEHDRLCGCRTNHRDHRRQRFAAEVEVTLLAARDRDGAALFESVARIIRPGTYDGEAASTAVSYSTSLAAAACRAFAESGLPRRHEALLHLLAWHATTPEHWSIAGVAYRVCAAVMSCLDLGPAMADQVIHPELTALRATGGQGMARVLAVVGPAYGSLLSDDPGEHINGLEIDLVRHPLDNASSPPPPSSFQVEAAQLGLRYALAYRNEDLDAVKDLVMEHGARGVALAGFGICNQLAARVRELWD